MVDSGGGLMGGVDPALAGQLGKLPQVQAATGLGIGLAEVNGKVEQVSAVDPHAASQIFDVSPVRGSIAGLGRDGIAVYKDVATADHLKLGSTVPVLFKDTGPQKLTVALIYGEATGAPAPRYFMGNEAYNANFPIRYDSRVFVKKAPGASHGGRAGGGPRRRHQVLRHHGHGPGRVQGRPGQADQPDARRWSTPCSRWPSSSPCSASATPWPCRSSNAPASSACCAPSA